MLLHLLQQLYVGVGKGHRILYAIVLTKANGYHIGLVAAKAPWQCVDCHVDFVVHLRHNGCFIAAAVHEANARHGGELPLGV